MNNFYNKIDFVIVHISDLNENLDNYTNFNEKNEISIKIQELQEKLQELKQTNSPIQ